MADEAIIIYKALKDAFTAAQLRGGQLEGVGVTDYHPGDVTQDMCPGVFLHLGKTAIVDHEYVGMAARFEHSIDVTLFTSDTYGEYYPDAAPYTNGSIWLLQKVMNVIDAAVAAGAWQEVPRIKIVDFTHDNNVHIYTLEVVLVSPVYQRGQL
jgi:hypothetical protein